MIFGTSCYRQMIIIYNHNQVNQRTFVQYMSHLFHHFSQQAIVSTYQLLHQFHKLAVVSLQLLLWASIYRRPRVIVYFGIHVVINIDNDLAQS